MSTFQAIRHKTHTETVRNIGHYIKLVFLHNTKELRPKLLFPLRKIVSPGNLLRPFNLYYSVWPFSDPITPQKSVLVYYSFTKTEV